MTVSLILTEQIVKLFIILMIGFIMVRIGLLKVSDSKSISVLLVYLVLPCMIVNSFQIEYTPEVLKGLIFTVVAAVIAHIVFLILTAFLKKPLHLDMVEELTTVYTNGGILVVPLVKALLGTEYVIYSCSFLAVQMILIWTHGRHKMCSEERLSLKKIFWNANIVAICIGAFLFVTKIELPDVIGGTIDMLAEMIGPIGMLLAGMAISEIPFKKIFMEKRNYLAVLLRLFIYPLVVLIVFKVLDLTDWIADGKNLLLIVFLACVTPACATVTSMAQLYDKNSAEASLFYVLTTLFSILSMPLMILVFEIFC